MASPVEVKTEETAKREDITKSPAQASEQTEPKETIPKKEKEQDEKVINLGFVINLKRIPIMMSSGLLKLKLFQVITLRSSQLFYVFVLRVEIISIFEPKVVTVSAHNTIIYESVACRQLNQKTHSIFFQQEEDEVPKGSPEPVDDLFEPLTPDKSPTDLFMSDEEDLEQVSASIDSLQYSAKIFFCSESVSNFL